MRSHRPALLFFALVLGCTGGTSRLKREVLISTRRVAIVAFSGVAKLGEAPVQESLWEAVAKPGATELERKALRERRSEQAGAAYEALRASLVESVGWELLARETVATTVSSSRQPPPSDELLTIAGLPEARAFNQLSAAERAILAQRLGVDGLVSAEIEFRIVEGGGYRIAGFGNLTHHLIAVASLRLFDATGALAWEEREVSGTRTIEARSATTPDPVLESALMSEAARTSFHALAVRLAAPL